MGLFNHPRIRYGLAMGDSITRLETRVPLLQWLLGETFYSLCARRRTLLRFHARSCIEHCPSAEPVTLSRTKLRCRKVL